MIQSNLLRNEKGSYKIVESLGKFSVLEYDRDYSLNGRQSAVSEYYASRMNYKKKQLVCLLNNNGVIMQAGAMQIMAGDIKVTTNIKGVGDLVGKMFSGKVTNESGIKPRYTGVGTVILEPTYNYIILQDLAQWGGEMVANDGMFLATDDTVKAKVQYPQSISSALLGREGLFNIRLAGSGVVALESRVPYEELVVFDLKDDVIKIDGNMAVAWSPTLQFTVERTTATLVGSAASGEGLVNVYRGTGRILIATVSGKLMNTSAY